MFLKKYFSSTLFSKKNIFFLIYEIQYICSNIIMEYVENKKKVTKKKLTNYFSSTLFSIKKIISATILQAKEIP